jgi:hypothetical protein
MQPIELANHIPDLIEELLLGNPLLRKIEVCIDYPSNVRHRLGLSFSFFDCVELRIPKLSRENQFFIFSAGRVPVDPESFWLNRLDSDTMIFQDKAEWIMDAFFGLTEKLPDVCIL